MGVVRLVASLMVFEMSIVIDESILDKIMEHCENDSVSFFLRWLQDHSTKAVVVSNSWKAFEKKWDKQLKEYPESKLAFFQFIRGVVRPYKKEGYDNHQEDVDCFKATTTIVNRDYDIVEYLIVQNPAVYQGGSVKIADNRIVTLEGFADAINFPETK